MVVINDISKVIHLDSIVSWNRQKIHADYSQHIMNFRHKVCSFMATDRLLTDNYGKGIIDCSGFILDKNDLELFRHIAEDI